jgi:hypothetical protein
MPDTKAAITKVTKALKQVFNEREQQLAAVGVNTKLHPFNPKTGTWQKSGKYPRYVLYARFKDEQLEVGYFTDSPLKGRLGSFSGVANNRKGVPGLLVRLQLIFMKPDGTYELILDWEWLVLLLFAQSQIGTTSSETLNNFLPPKPSVDITNTEVPLTTVQLFSLLSDDEELMLPFAKGIDTSVKYQQASAAIQRYLSFDYPAAPAAGEEAPTAAPSTPAPNDAIGPGVMAALDLFS